MEDQFETSLDVLVEASLGEGQSLDQIIAALDKKLCELYDKVWEEQCSTKNASEK